MLTTKKFVSLLSKNKINFYCGVPDSCLKNFTNLITRQKQKNIISANEGSAVSTGIGYYLKTKKIPLIYMQNSGLGNAMDPLTSLTPKESYSIPMLLLIGWRGSPGLKKDEPQHTVMGRITLKILKLLDIKFIVIKSDKDLKKVLNLIKFSIKNKRPVACIVDRNTFSKTQPIQNKTIDNNLIFRPDAIECILRSIKKKSKIISTVGFTSRELHQIRKDKKIKSGKDFLMIGGMGHTATTSLGVALYEKEDVICLDGDGSFLMHMGGVATAASIIKKNFKYILFDNNSHESVGPTNQPTISNKLSFKKIAEGFGFKKTFILNSKKNFRSKLSKYIRKKGSVFILIKIKTGSLSNLERPSSMSDIKNHFMK